MHYQVAIIGSGPAGLTAGIYTSRAKLSTVIIEGNMPGGQLMTTTYIENWPGEKSIMGPDLMFRVREHAAHCGCTFASGVVTGVDFTQKPYVITLENGKRIEAQSIIIATGSSSKKLGCSGENLYWGRGVGVCATCDAPFYKDKEVIVVGGGNSAVTEAEHLTHFAKKVTIVHLLDSLTATDPIKDKVLAHPNIQVIYGTTVKEIQGDGQVVTGVILERKRDLLQTEMNVNGVFVAIGYSPNTNIFKDKLAIDQYGYLILKNNTQASIEGIFAAGDVADYSYRQAIVSAGMGCQAALDCQKYLSV